MCPVLFATAALLLNVEAIAGTIRYDGVYVHQDSLTEQAEGGNESEGKQHCYYLRFYPKGTVISVTSDCGEKAMGSIKKWFEARNAGPTHTGLARGMLRVKGKQLKFALRSKEGLVSYSGKFVGERIELKSHSHINGFNDKATYAFTPW